MKNPLSLTGLIYLILTITLVSCKNEDKVIKEQLTGTWDVISERYTEYQNNVITYDGTDLYGPNEMVIEFKSDATGQILEDGEVSDAFTWSITDGILILNSVSEGTKVVDVSFDGDTLYLKITAESTYDGVTYKAVSDLILTRV